MLVRNVVSSIGCIMLNALQVLAQLTTNTTEMIQRLNTTDCICDPKREGQPTSDSCTPRHVCGVGYWELTIALMVLSAVVVFVLAW